MKFSASMIKTWMNCGLQAKFSYIDELPQLQNAAASFGSCVHSALENYNKGDDIEEVVNHFVYYWDNPHELGVEPETWPKRTSHAGYREKGINMLYEYHENLQWSSREILGTEYRFCVPFGDHELSGIVDLLEVPNNKPILKIVDYKTGRRPNYDNLYLDIQFTAYSFASTKKEFWTGNGEEKYPGFPNGEELFEKFKDYERHAIWYDLQNNKEYDCGPRDDKDFMRLYRCCEQIARAVEYEVFVPSINGNSCMWCSYTDICPAYIPVHESGTKGV